MSESPSGIPQAPNAQPNTGSARPAPGVPVGTPVYAPQPPQPAPVQPKKSKGPIIAIAIAVACLLVLGGMVAACNALVGSITSPGGRPTSSFSQNVGVIHVEGTIGSGMNTPERFSAMLEEAEDDDSIKALLLRVDSGGGVASDGEEMAKYLKDFSKPVVVSSGSMNASAAYEISSQANYIYCNRATEVGSIGTVMQAMDYSGLMEMLGIKTTNIASAESKDSSYGTRPLTEEEIAYYQAIVNEINESFINTVAEGRKMGVEDVRKLATGLVFTGEQGVKNGLVDEIGTYRDALAKAAELSGIEGDAYGTVALDYTSDFDSLLNLLGEQATKEQLRELIKEELEAGSATPSVNQ